MFGPVGACISCSDISSCPHVCDKVAYSGHSSSLIKSFKQPLPFEANAVVCSNRMNAEKQGWLGQKIKLETGEGESIKES